MSNETAEAEDQELKEMEQKIEAEIAQKAEAESAKAEQEIAPTPEPEVSPATPEPTPDAAPTPEVPVTPNQSKAEKPQDDPLTWAKQKGLDTPESLARALRQKEIEFHKRNQAGHPGYQDLNGTQAPPPPPQNWQPRPDMGNGYPPPYYPPQYGRTDPTIEVGRFYGLEPEDVRRLAPFIMDAARNVASQERAALEKELNEVRQSTQRNNELLSLTQDPAFRDVRVQKEIHAILDADPSMFQREATPYASAFQKALANLARQQLQHGVVPETEAPKPPVTAGGGNGSAFTAPVKFNDPAFLRMFETWTVEQQEAFIDSGGKRFPKR